MLTDHLYFLFSVLQRQAYLTYVCHVKKFEEADVDDERKVSRRVIFVKNSKNQSCARANKMNRRLQDNLHLCI